MAIKACPAVEGFRSQMSIQRKMDLKRVFLSAAVAIMCASASALATQVSQKPSLDQVFKSIHDSTAGRTQSVNPIPFLLLILAAALMYVAVKYWNRRQTTPKSLNNHAKLLKEAAGVSGVSARQLKALESLAKAQGLSSPLVALICPSAITQLAKQVKTNSEKQALTDLAKRVLKP